MAGMAGLSETGAIWAKVSRGIMIVRLLLEGLFSLGRRPAVPTLRADETTRTRAHARRGARPPRPAMGGRPDLLLLTGAMSAPQTLPPRPARPRLQTASRRWAA